MPGVYLVDEEGNPISATNPLDVSAAFTAGDIEIGAVELKNGTDDTRASIDPTYGLRTERKARPLTTVTHGVGTAGAASTTALAANASRRFAEIVNDSANIVYLFLGTPAVLNTGIRLNANGGSYVIDETNLYTGIITCISSIAAQNLVWTEGV